MKNLPRLRQFLSNVVHKIDLDKPDENGRYDDHQLKLVVDSKSDNTSNLCTIDLKESHNNARLRTVTLTGLDAGSLILKPDNFWIQYYADNTWGKACDYLIFTLYNGKKYALFIDLKTKIASYPSSNNDLRFDTYFNKNIAWQMIGADAILDGFIDILYKKDVKARQITRIMKKGAAKAALSDFKRRYLVLYKSVDPSVESSAIPTKGYYFPNETCLESSIKARKTSEKEMISLSSLFTCNIIDA